MKRSMPGVIVLALLAACGVLGTAAARGKDFSVAEELIVITPPDANGNVTVSGAPLAVRVGPNDTATFTLENSSLKPKIPPRQGVVGPDGSFSAQIPGIPGHKIKITIGSLSGASKKVKKKVPMGPSQGPPPSKKSAFSQSSPRSWLRPAEPTPEITINYRDRSSQPAASPLDPTDEVRQSGVLPPE
jgi:hypothetical protein